MAVFLVSNPLIWVEKIPILCGREQCRPEGFTVHVICCCDFFFVLLGDSK